MGSCSCSLAWKCRRSCATLGDYSKGQAIFYGVVISVVIILTASSLPSFTAGWTRLIGRWIPVADQNPGWRGPLVIGWAGMRGVVSLASALSIPLLLNNGEPFPFRSLILCITFIVILITLVLQGLTLPWVIKLVGLDKEQSPISEQEEEAKLHHQPAHRRRYAPGRTIHRPDEKTTGAAKPVQPVEE